MLGSYCGVLDDTEDDTEDIFNNSGGLVVKAPAHDKNVVKTQTFLRLCAVRLRLRNDCGLDNLRVMESQVLRSVSRWYSPVAFGSPATARHLAAARVIAGFVDRDVIKWLLIRRRSVQLFAAHLVQKWFRGSRVIRLALNLFAPFLSTSTGYPFNTVPPWCIYHVHIAWIQTGKNEWSQWVLRFKARGNQVHPAVLHPDEAPLSTSQSEMWLCLNLAVVTNGPTLDNRVVQLICLTSVNGPVNHFTHNCTFTVGSFILVQHQRIV